MKTVGIDARLINQTGVGTYIRNLLYYLSEFDTTNLIFYIYMLEDDASQFDFKKNNFVKKITSARWHSVAEQLFFWRDLMRDNLDLMHFTYFSFPILYRRPYVATIHDLTPLYFKTGRASTKNPLIYNIKYAGLTNILTSQIRNARAIITPTNYIKEQIVEHFGPRFADKINPIYEGIDRGLETITPNNNLQIKYGTDFFIYVGNFYPHKNVLNLIKAFSRIKKSEKLILIGPVDYFSEYARQLIVKLNETGRIVFFRNPKPADSAFFYSHAKALLHPSLSEGFGLPIAEAMYFNLPIIASNIPVFKEILGQSYISFDPHSVDDITNKISFFLENIQNKPKYDDILTKLSFRTMTEKTLEIYRKNLL